MTFNGDSCRVTFLVEVQLILIRFVATGLISYGEEANGSGPPEYRTWQRLHSLQVIELPNIDSKPEIVISLLRSIRSLHGHYLEGAEGENVQTWPDQHSMPSDALASSQLVWAVINALGSI